MELNIYTYEGRDYYLLDELKEYDPAFFYGCAQKGPEKIVAKKNISDYKIVKHSKDEEEQWTESTFAYKRSKLLVGLRWASNNIPKLCGKKDKYKYEEAPPLLELSDEECFKDKNGYILEVEVRGERNEDKVLFKAKDIGRIFEMENLNIVIVEKKSFVKGEDYHVFSINTELTFGSGSTKNKIRPCIFLTYNGLLKVVFSSRSGIAKTFRSWATRVIYTTHLGTQKQREEVSKMVLKADHKSVKVVLGKSVSGTPCIYLFSLGKVKDLKKLDYFKEILKNFSCGTVYKWGRTIDLKRRTGEHMAIYGCIEGVKLNLELYAYIDPIYTVDAENDIKGFLQPFSLNGMENFKELVILNQDEFSETKTQYRELKEQYGGCLKELLEKSGRLEQEIKDLNYQLTIKNRDVELAQERLKSSSLEKDVEILNLKLQLASISK